MTMGKRPKIIGLSGVAGSGKDETARILHDLYGYERVAFADKLKELVKLINPYVEAREHEGVVSYHRVVSALDNFGDEAKRKYPEYRRLLQATGVGARQVLGEDIWVNAALRSLKNDKYYVITDCRFENEAREIKERGGFIYRVKRPGVEPVNNHISETALDDYPMHGVIKNDGDLATLKLRVQEIFG